ncbi:MAG: hypothetical protein NTV89_08870 [Proteobacteria bacterium]|nr:hypothetical protein [Pseudomonadota bacterium]
MHLFFYLPDYLLQLRVRYFRVTRVGKYLYVARDVIGKKLFLAAKSCEQPISWCVCIYVLLPCFC